MAGGTDDAQLMTRFASGDLAAFETLYSRHKGALYRYFLRQCGDPEMAAELFQEVWVRVIKARERNEPRAPFTTYMYQIGHNCLVDHYRKAGRSLTDGNGEPEASEIPDLLAEELDPAFASARWSLVDWEQGPADPAPGPEAANSVAQRAARLWSALEALPPEQREAFLLHEEGEMGLAEIATATGANAETVKSRLRYAVRKLRAALGDLAPAGSREALS
ncbi:MAG: sigma-70 family RNA polymerase sigma factor [Chromatiales bacterium]|nr:sigma-70 family RNA polymerase sigma factor [Chromatiales bacterium]